MKSFTANLKAFKKAVHAKLKSAFLKKSSPPTRENKKETMQFEKPLALAYGLMGERTGRLMPIFKDLDHNLEMSGLKINFKAYVSLTVLASALMALSVLIALPLLFFFAFRMSFLSALLFGFGGALMIWALSIVGFYAYPLYRADKHKRELDDELPFTTGYLSILASAGVAPERMFYSISTLDMPLAASFEAKEIVKEVNLFGMDFISALEKTSS
jgi:archaeal flagellar protein FlaJ